MLVSFVKAKDLLRLADFAAARYRGVTLRDVADAFGISHRTAQRWMANLVDAFPHAVTVEDDPDRQRRWIVREVSIARLRLQGNEELEALDYAAARLTEAGDTRLATALGSLRDRLVAALPAPAARRAEADAEALLEAHGVAARPGPIAVIDPAVVAATVDALRGPFRLRISYQGAERVVEPYGVLLGARRYLVARQPDKDDRLRHFRFDRIETASATDEVFARDPGFDLSAHAARSFGSFQDEAEFGTVVWRFAPHAADAAAGWCFHPGQRTRRLDDGSLEVTFDASGWLEMAWHLYQWGDAVEVVAPEGLARLVHPARRGDFNALP